MTTREQIVDIAANVQWIRKGQDAMTKRIDDLESTIREQHETFTDTRAAQLSQCERRFVELDKAVVVNKTKLGLLVAGGVIAIQAVIALVTAVVKQAFYEGR